MKKARWLLLVLFLFAITKCGDIPRPFPLSQSEDQVARIELLQTEIEGDDSLPDFVLLCEVPRDRIEEFVLDLQQLDCRRNGFDPATGYGELVIRIVYHNGDADLIGYANNAYVTEKGIEHDVYYFDSKEFKELFAQYAGDSMPENAMTWVELYP